ARSVGRAARERHQVHRRARRRGADRGQRSGRRDRAHLRGQRQWRRLRAAVCPQALPPFPTAAWGGRVRWPRCRARHGPAADRGAGRARVGDRRSRAGRYRGFRAAAPRCRSRRQQRWRDVVTDCVGVEILLVEDNPDDAELTLRVLSERKLANNLVWVRNGADALDFLFRRGAYAGRPDRETPRLILLDLNLPKVSGIEVLARIKSDPATHKLPVVVLSSSTQDKDVLASYDLGVNSYVSKPVRFEEFARVVGELGMYWLL